jgi:hypothetical protein
MTALTTRGSAPGGNGAEPLDARTQSGSTGAAHVGSGGAIPFRLGAPGSVAAPPAAQDGRPGAAGGAPDSPDGHAGAVTGRLLLVERMAPWTGAAFPADRSAARLRAMADGAAVVTDAVARVVAPRLGSGL